MTKYSSVAEAIDEQSARGKPLEPGSTQSPQKKINLRSQVGHLSTKKNLSLVLRQWHQRAGLFAFLFMAWLGFSGVLLNQSASWGLDAIRVKSAALMAMYGVYPQVPHTGYFSGGHWLVSTTENTVIDGRLLQ